MPKAGPASKKARPISGNLSATATTKIAATTKVSGNVYYRQRVHPRPSFIARNHVIASDDGFAGEMWRESPALFQRWVCHEAVLALLGRPVPGVISPRLNSRTAAGVGAAADAQPGCVAPAPAAPDGSVK